MGRTQSETIYIPRTWRSNQPFKVRRIRLLQAVGLPLDETLIFGTKSLVGDLPQTLQMTIPFFEKYGGVIVRTAWEPAILKAPYHYAFQLQDFERILQGIIASDFRKGHSRMTHIIIHGNWANLSDPNDRYKYIAGRMLFHPDQDIPRDKTLEMVYGEYIARVFDAQGFDFSDDRFAGYKLDVGQKCWRQFKTSPWITENDVKNILNQFKRLEVRILDLQKTLSYSARCPIGRLVLSVEFEASKNSKKMFFIYDFDYAFSI